MTQSAIRAQPLIDAIKAGVTAAGVAIREAKKPDVVGTRPYIVAFFDGGTVSNRTLASRDGWALIGSFRCAGLTPESSRVAMEALRSALLGLHRTVVGGRTVQMPEHLTTVETRDDDADPPLFIQIDEWRLRTTP